MTGLGGRSEDLEIIGNGSLTISRVSLADEGQYTCAASNDVGDPISKTVNLKINGKHQHCLRRTIKQFAKFIEFWFASGKYLVSKKYFTQLVLGKYFDARVFNFQRLHDL